MKKNIIAGAAAFSLAAPIIAGTSIALSSPATAEIEGDLSVDYASQYSYRGMNDIISEGLGLIPGADAEHVYNTELNLNYALNDKWTLFAGMNIRSLTDTSVDHNSYRIGARYTTDAYTIEFGHQRHELAQILTPVAGLGTLDTTEIFLSISTECPLTGGTVKLFAAHDIDELDGTYVELSLSKGWELNESTNLNVTAGVSYSFNYWDNFLSVGPVQLLNTGNDWNHAYLTVSLDYQLAENVTLTPYVSYSRGFGALDPSNTGVAIINTLEESDELIYGLKASIKF